MNRGKILEAWRGKIASGAMVKGGPGGPDYVVVSNADKLGVKDAVPLAALLPIGDANALSLAAAKERSWGPLPVIAGVCATDPLRMMDKFLLDMKAAGIAGVQNRPSVGGVDGSFRKVLEETQMGYPREIEMIRLASALDLITAALAFNPEDAQKMAEVGADIIVADPGFIEKKEHSRVVREIAEAARSSRKGVLVFGLGEDREGLDGIQSE